MSGQKRPRKPAKETSGQKRPRKTPRTTARGTPAAKRPTFGALLAARAARDESDTESEETDATSGDEIGSDDEVLEVEPDDGYSEDDSGESEDGDEGEDGDYKEDPEEYYDDSNGDESAGDNEEEDETVEYADVDADGDNGTSTRAVDSGCVWPGYDIRPIDSKALDTMVPPKRFLVDHTMKSRTSKTDTYSVDLESVFKLTLDGRRAIMGGGGWLADPRNLPGVNQVRLAQFVTGLGRVMRESAQLGAVMSGSHHGEREPQLDLDFNFAYLPVSLQKSGFYKVWVNTLGYLIAPIQQNELCRSMRDPGFDKLRGMSANLKPTSVTISAKYTGDVLDGIIGRFVRLSPDVTSLRGHLPPSVAQAVFSERIEHNYGEGEKFPAVREHAMAGVTNDAALYDTELKQTYYNDKHMELAVNHEHVLVRGSLPKTVSQWTCSVCSASYIYDAGAGWTANVGKETKRGVCAVQLTNPRHVLQCPFTYSTEKSLNCIYHLCDVCATGTQNYENHDTFAQKKTTKWKLERHVTSYDNLGYGFADWRGTATGGAAVVTRIRSIYIRSDVMLPGPTLRTQLEGELAEEPSADDSKGDEESVDEGGAVAQSSYYDTAYESDGLVFLTFLKRCKGLQRLQIPSPSLLNFEKERANVPYRGLPRDSPDDMFEGVGVSGAKVDKYKTILEVILTDLKKLRSLTIGVTPEYESLVRRVEQKEGKAVYTKVGLYDTIEVLRDLTRIITKQRTFGTKEDKPGFKLAFVRTKQIKEAKLTYCGPRDVHGQDRGRKTPADISEAEELVKLCFVLPAGWEIDLCGYSMVPEVQTRILTALGNKGKRTVTMGYLSSTTFRAMSEEQRQALVLTFEAWSGDKPEKIPASWTHKPATTVPDVELLGHSAGNITEFPDSVFKKCVKHVLHLNVATELTDALMDEYMHRMYPNMPTGAEDPVYASLDTKNKSVKTTLAAVLAVVAEYKAAAVRLRQAFLACNTAAGDNTALQRVVSQRVSDKCKEQLGTSLLNMKSLLMWEERLSDCECSRSLEATLDILVDVASDEAAAVSAALHDMGSMFSAFEQAYFTATERPIAEVCKAMRRRLATVKAGEDVEMEDAAGADYDDGIVLFFDEHGAVTRREPFAEGEVIATFGDAQVVSLSSEKTSVKALLQDAKFWEGVSGQPFVIKIRHKTTDETAYIADVKAPSSGSWHCFERVATEEEANTEIELVNDEGVLRVSFKALRILTVGMKVRYFVQAALDVTSSGVVMRSA